MVYSRRIHFSLGFGIVRFFFSVICAPSSGPQLNTAASQRTLQYSEEQGHKKESKSSKDFRRHSITRAEYSKYDTIKKGFLYSLSALILLQSFEKPPFPPPLPLPLPTHPDSMLRQDQPFPSSWNIFRKVGLCAHTTK